MNPITRLRHGLFLTNKHLTPSEASLEIITSPVPILFIKMFIQADNYFDILIHRKLIIIWSTQQTEKWDDTRHRQSRSKPDSFLFPASLYWSCTELRLWQAWLAGAASSQAVTASLWPREEGGCSADCQPATRPQNSHINTTLLQNPTQSNFLPATWLLALFKNVSFWPLMYLLKASHLA